MADVQCSTYIDADMCGSLHAIFAVNCRYLLAFPFLTQQNFPVKVNMSINWACCLLNSRIISALFSHMKSSGLIIDFEMCRNASTCAAKIYCNEQR